MRIALVADSHLSERAPECVSNWEVAGAVVRRMGAELTIHLGDISLDGQSHPEELRFAAEAVRRWPTPMICLPGNHDMGDGSGEVPLDRERLARCRQAFGADRWAVRADRWELIGLNAQLLGTGTPEEDVAPRTAACARACASSSPATPTSTSIAARRTSGTCGCRRPRSCCPMRCRRALPRRWRRQSSRL
jgi:hypothetical protein